MMQAQFEKTFEGWRTKARDFLVKGLPPQDVQWSESQTSLLLPINSFDLKPLQKMPTVPGDFLKVAQAVAYARDEDRWDLLYRILFRLLHEDPNLMKITTDSDILRANHLSHSVRRDIHKMHAFVRFKRTVIDGIEHFVAWHKPEHFSLRPGVDFFARRFGDKKWSIFTPDESAHWDLEKITFSEGMPQHQFQVQDDWDDVWKTYYKSIFNPARIKIKMMKSEMSPKYWGSMPETSLIDDLVREAPKRLQNMAERHQSAALVDPNLSLSELKTAAQSCQACPLFQTAHHLVFGEGPANAKIMIVGEQPGDQEDMAGKVFVGPAGQVLDSALKAAGIDRSGLYLTNAVKHFKWIQQGKVRLHQKPSGREMHACKPWLEAEIAKVKPEIILALGATAATAVLGRLPKISSERGQVITNSNLAPKVIVSWHPSAILRSSNEEEAAQRLSELVYDLGLASRNQS